MKFFCFCALALSMAFCSCGCGNGAGDISSTAPAATNAYAEDEKTRTNRELQEQLKETKAVFKKGLEESRRIRLQEIAAIERYHDAQAATMAKPLKLLYDCSKHLHSREDAREKAFEWDKLVRFYRDTGDNALANEYSRNADKCTAIAEKHNDWIKKAYRTLYDVPIHLAGKTPVPESMSEVGIKEKELYGNLGDLTLTLKSFSNTSDPNEAEELSARAAQQVNKILDTWKEMLDTQKYVLQSKFG